MGSENFYWSDGYDIDESAKKLEEARKNYEAGKYNNTMAYCRTALRLNPSCAKDVYFLMGLADLKLGTLTDTWDFNDTIAACEHFGKVIELAPDWATGYLYRGIAIVHWGNNYEAAIEDFDKVLELEPDNEWAKRYRTICQKCLNTPITNDDIDWDRIDKLPYDEAMQCLERFFFEKYKDAQEDLNELLELKGMNEVVSLASNNLSAYEPLIRD